jgi:hypothetical protein
MPRRPKRLKNDDDDAGDDDDDDKSDDGSRHKYTHTNPAEHPVAGRLENPQGDMKHHTTKHHTTKQHTHTYPYTQRNAKTKNEKGEKPQTTEQQTTTKKREEQRKQERENKDEAAQVTKENEEDKVARQRTKKTQ